MEENGQCNENVPGWPLTSNDHEGVFTRLYWLSRQISNYIKEKTTTLTFDFYASLTNTKVGWDLQMVFRYAEPKSIILFCVKAVLHSFFINSRRKKLLLGGYLVGILGNHVTKCYWLKRHWLLGFWGGRRGIVSFALGFRVLIIWHWNFVAFLCRDLILCPSLSEYLAKSDWYDWPWKGNLILPDYPVFWEIQKPIQC